MIRKISSSLSRGPCPYNLTRFVEAQDRVYHHVREELKRGRKTSHWMWFIFPQIRGLGFSATAQRYSISSLEEAAAFLDHSTLGPRLRECTQLVVDVEGQGTQQILGSPDDLKFCSSMTLFLNAADDKQLFQTALSKYCAGEQDPLKLLLLPFHDRLGHLLPVEIELGSQDEFVGLYWSVAAPAHPRWQGS